MGVLGIKDGGGPGTSHRSRYLGHIDVDQDIWDIDVDLELIAFFCHSDFLDKEIGLNSKWGRICRWSFVISRLIRPRLSI